MPKDYRHVRFLKKNQHFFNLVAPIGGFGNHIRWLLMLDPAYSFIMLHDAGIDRYQTLQGPDWPLYEQYTQSDWTGILPNIKQEILDSMEADGIELKTLQQKINFILNNVYHADRTWNNWLWYEWQYRYALDKVIDFAHRLELLHCQDSQTLILSVDPELARFCYLKFNSNLNNLPPAEFINKWQSIHGEIMQKTTGNNNIKILTSDVIYQPELNRHFYSELIDFLGLTDLYSDANLIHQIWYQAHQQSQKQFVNDINEFYK